MFLIVRVYGCLSPFTQSFVGHFELTFASHWWMRHENHKPILHNLTPYPAFFINDDYCANVDVICKYGFSLGKMMILLKLAQERLSKRRLLLSAGILYTWFLLIDKKVTSQIIWTKEVLIRLLFSENLRSLIKCTTR